MTEAIISPFIRSPAAGLGTRCVILDACADTELKRWIYELAPAGSPVWAPLFHDTAYAELDDCGPALVLCDAKDGWADYASALLEQSSAGCVLYVDDLQNWTDAVKHCQSLLTVGTEQQGNQLMRFFEPRWLEPLVTTLSADEQQAFLGPFSGLAWRNELGWRYLERFAPWNGEVQQPKWLRMGRARQQDMVQARLRLIASELTNDYRTILDMPEPEAYVYEQLRAAQAVGVEQKAHFERWLRLALSNKGAPWPSSAARQVMARDDLVIAGKLDELESLLG